MIKHSATDMYLTVGSPPSLRIRNDIKPMNSTILKQHDIEHFIGETLNISEKNKFNEELEVNFTLVRDEDNSRFRFNLFRQQQKSGIVIRRINTIIPTFNELHLPDIYGELIMKKRGLIILSSPSGSGKSTSMAAMINHRNTYGSGHILTIEDPIEFIHNHNKCIITQREVGTDTYSYHNALKNALRQRADVIAIGEVRDKDGMEHALRFAETGHLCIITLHSNNASQAINRIVNLFPDEARKHILITLSQNLLAILSQKLIPNLNQGYSIAIEIMKNEGLIKKLIADNKIDELDEALKRGKDSGMQTFDQSIYKLLEKSEISMPTALAESENPTELKMKTNKYDYSGNDELSNSDF